MQAGKEARAIWTDQHAQHIMEHKTLLANADARKDPALLERVFAHIQDHINLLQNTPPEKLIMTGQQPLPNPEEMMAQEGGQPGGQPGGQEGKAPELSEDLAQNNPVLKEGRNVGMPKMPKNPLSGERFNLATGGL
jgi:hypothetical protein